MPRPPKRTSHVGSIQVLAEVHQRQERAQDSRFQIVGQVQPARCHSGQPLTVLGDEAHDLSLPLMRSVAQSRFAAHLCAASFDGEREMQNANLLLVREGWRRVVLASRYFARCGHGERELWLSR